VIITFLNSENRYTHAIESRRILDKKKNGENMDYDLVGMKVLIVEDMPDNAEVNLIQDAVQSSEHSITVNNVDVTA
jgi:hypothetical protein